MRQIGHWTPAYILRNPFTRRGVSTHMVLFALSLFMLACEPSESKGQADPKGSKTLSNFSGKWQGVGQISDGKTAHNCSNMQLSLTHNDQRVVIHSLSISCDTQNIKLGPVILVIENNILYLLGEEVGEINGNEIRIAIANSEATYEISMRVKEKFLDFRGEISSNLVTGLLRKI